MKNDIYYRLLINNQEWVHEKLATDDNYFKKLEEGQKPKFLFIGCSDSRVAIELITKVDAGEIFVHRNIANQVGLRDMNFLSVLEYSIEVLKVEHVIVMGHYGCGGIKAAIDVIDQGLIENWVSPLRDVFFENRKELEIIENEDDRLDKLSEYNVVEQVKKLFKTPVMHRSVKSGEYPFLHGWIFDIRTGLIKELDVPVEEWRDYGWVPKEYNKKPEKKDV